jgi:hypothetical protein
MTKGNWRLWKTTEAFTLVGIKFIRGMYTFSLMYLPETIVAPMTFTPISLTISQVPLQRPIEKSTFLVNTTVTPFLKMQLMIMHSSAFNII